MAGILSDPIDDDPPGRRDRNGPRWPAQSARPGLVVRHRTTGIVGSIVGFKPRQVTLVDQNGREHVLPLADGAFSVGGTTVTLVRPSPPSSPGPARLTASGSIASADTRPRIAQPSRILVEGIHDAELVEKIWGDDLRAEGVVVEPLHGVDKLVDLIQLFDPGPGRRLGILLDHLVDDSKESRLAEAARQPHVLVRGHYFVDVWQAVRPALLGLDQWPSIEKGRPWKESIRQELGFLGTTGQLWQVILSRVTSYRDLEPSLVGAMEELIDFVAPPTDHPR